MSEITEGVIDRVIIDSLSKNVKRLQSENKAHRQVAINIQDTLTKSTAQYKAEITKLKEMLNEAADTLVDNDDYTVQALNSIGHDLKREVAE